MAENQNQNQNQNQKMESTGGSEPEAQSFMQLMYEQAAELDAVDRIRNAGQAAARTGQQMMSTARDFAMEISDRLFPDPKEKDKI